MDNTKFHKMFLEGTPRYVRKKQKLINFCEVNNILVNPGELKSLVWAGFKAWIEQNVTPIIVKMVETAGHTVVCSPSHHSNLQSTELVWANIKGTVGRQYTIDKTFQDVKQRLV